MKGKLWLARGENGVGEWFWGRKAEEEEGGCCCVLDKGQRGWCLEEEERRGCLVLSGVVLAKGRVQLWLVSKEDKKKER
jgi:hypothetical protein